MLLIICIGIEKGKVILNFLYLSRIGSPQLLISPMMPSFVRLCGRRSFFFVLKENLVDKEEVKLVKLSNGSLLLEQYCKIAGLHRW